MCSMTRLAGKCCVLTVTPYPSSSIHSYPSFSPSPSHFLSPSPTLTSPLVPSPPFSHSLSPFLSPISLTLSGSLSRSLRLTSARPSPPPFSSQEHCVVESKPDSTVDDLRLHRPWPELQR